MDLEVADLMQKKFFPPPLGPGCKVMLIDGWARNHEAVTERAA